jgi:predicted phage baseplate assembly protein
MSIPLPNLDDRRWRDLAEEGRKLIPVYAPEWTDHNVHDPGITLIELFAWLAETELYRLNRIPDRHKLKFLSLADFYPQPPQASRAVLSLAVQNNAPPLSLPASVEFAGHNSSGQMTRFRALEPITAAPTLLRLFKLKTSRIS